MRSSHNLFSVLGPELSPDFTNKVSTAVVHRVKFLNSIKKEFLNSMRAAVQAISPPCKCDKICVEVTELLLADGTMYAKILIIFEGSYNMRSLKKKITLGSFPGKMYGWFFRTNHLPWNRFPEAKFSFPELGKEKYSFKELFGDTTLGLEIEI